MKYGWVAHDGVNFGIQDIAERGYMLRTEFVKRVNGDHGGDWTWRISGRQVFIFNINNGIAPVHDKF